MHYSACANFQVLYNKLGLNHDNLTILPLKTPAVQGSKFRPSPSFRQLRAHLSFARVASAVDNPLRIDIGNKLSELRPVLLPPRVNAGLSGETGQSGVITPKSTLARGSGAVSTRELVIEDGTCKRCVDDN
jgi:hypothetical protein